MRKTLAIASAVMLMTGAAVAQSGSSSADKPGASGQQPTTDGKQTSPGTTGAMNNEAGGVATSPQDVQKQGGAATAPNSSGTSDSGGKTTGGAGEKPK